MVSRREKPRRLHGYMWRKGILPHIHTCIELRGDEALQLTRASMNETFVGDVISVVLSRIISPILAGVVYALMSLLMDFGRAV